MYNFILINATEEMKEIVRKLAYKLARRIYRKSNLMLHEENDWFIAFEP